MRDGYGSDAARPRVFDPDDPEAVLAAAEPVAEPEPPQDAAPARRRPWIGRSLVALVAVIALGIGVFSGLRWQQHRDSARDDRAVALTVRVGGVEPNLTGSGPATVDTTVDNRGPRAVTIESYALTAGRWHGTAPSIVVPNTAPTEVDVPVSFPCSAEIPVQMNVRIRVRTSDGHETSIERALDSSEEVGDQVCESSTSTPTGTVTSYRSTAAGADVSVRVVAPTGGQPISNVSVSAPPFTADLTIPTGAPSGLAMKARASADVVVHLEISGVCDQGLSSTGLPSALTLSAGDEKSGISQTTAALPLALVSSLAARVQSACPSKVAP